VEATVDTILYPLSSILSSLASHLLFVHQVSINQDSNEERGATIRLPGVVGPTLYDPRFLGAIAHMSVGDPIAAGVVRRLSRPGASPATFRKRCGPGRCLGDLP
jgi:hypothetical protein